MGRRGGGGRAGGAWIGGCVLALAATLVVCVLVIRGAGGLKQYHAPAFARKILLSITSGHPQDNLNIVLHPSQLQTPRLQSLGLNVKPPAATSRRVNVQQELYAPSPTISHRGLAIPPLPTTSPPVFPPPIRSYPPLPANKPYPNRPAVSPASIIHPTNHGKAHGVPIAAHSKERHHHSMLVNNTHGNTHAGPVVAPPKGRHHHSLPDLPILLQILPVSIENMTFQLLHLQSNIPAIYHLHIIGPTKACLHLKEMHEEILRMHHVIPMNITRLQILQNLVYHL
uniref:Uncharacterized protein n=1 Tax=Oryza rufipogon TaxID=4529 RepID=A0A0E0N1I1_ORYRU